MKNQEYTVHQFKPAEWQLFKAMRLEALQNEPGLFGNSHRFEAAFPDERWQDSLKGPAKGFFGLYHGNELIGITSIIGEEARPGIAKLTASYIRKEHRGKGLSTLLYEARLKWAEQHGVKKLIISHRKSNEASRRANQHYGFRYTHAEPRLWPDGTEEENVFYELNL